MGFLNIQPWGNKTINNGHVVGEEDQISIYWATNLSLDSYRRRWWFEGGEHLFPCGCSPTAGWDVPNHRIDDIEFRHENKANFIPTQGTPGQAQNMRNRGLVDYPDPTFGDSIFPGGDQLQGQLYEALNSYWLGSVP